MKSKELRQKFLQFFEAKGHSKIPSASLVPSETDSTVLFTTAGMQPLVPFLNGEKHSAGDKLVNTQKCIRTDDINEVGDKTHNTFFEMLGYWSLGAYWKKEAINLTAEFLTKELGVDVQKIAVTCFEGDDANDIPKDTESAEIWKDLGIAEKRITYLGRKDNFWGPVGTEGPCGPDTEIFYWTGSDNVPEIFDLKDKNWVEIGNDVFMVYEKKGDKYLPLAQRNVDFGSGFERLLAVLNNVDEIYTTDLFETIIQEIEKISGKKYTDHPVEFRIIADHIRAATFAINDGVLPSNKDAGYIVRRLIRRAIVKAQTIGIKENFTAQIAEKVFDIYTDAYDFNKENILNELEKEENKFRKTLEAGLRILNSQKEITAKILFDLYQSYGLPLEISVEESARVGSDVNNETIEQYNNLLAKHQELSRTASAGMFKGGLADSGEETTKLHTAAHLLLAALRKILGQTVEQKGSNITPERLRFDFSWDTKMTDEQVKQVEDMVNENIQKDFQVDMTEMKLEDAYASGATGVFGSKYADMVKVYTIGSSTSLETRDFISREICGGPHVTNTGALGHFKILKEESSSAGVRRIKAILDNIYQKTRVSGL